jgi:RNA polymerase sigma factor for flagellar operon FliA
MKTLAEPREELQELWQQFAGSRNNKAREKLLLHYLPLVRQVAGRIKTGLPASVEYEDLVNTGLVGLIGSIDNFNLERGFKFETYAVPRIRGAMLDGLRDVDWLPRSFRQKTRQLDQAVAKLTGEHGRSPDDREIAGELGLDDDGYQRFMDQVGAASLVSLDVKIKTDDEGETGSLHEVIPDTETPSPLDNLEEADARAMVVKLVANLSEQERAVVALYYYEELTFKEIGQVIGVSESRVCQIHTRILATLRARLTKLLE